MNPFKRVLIVGGGIGGLTLPWLWPDKAWRRK